uniref:Uncharacterized protein n=1 Tax=Romanomermis culicivorax TaxID=13658 RepID=A0A915J7V2_ROMCU
MAQYVTIGQLFQAVDDPFRQKRQQRVLNVYTCRWPYPICSLKSGKVTSILNLLASTIMLATIATWKPVHHKGIVQIFALMFSEALLSTFYISLNVYHLYNYITDGHEFMSAKACWNFMGPQALAMDFRNGLKNLVSRIICLS